MKQKKKKKRLGKILLVLVIAAILVLAGLFFDLGGFGSQLGLPTFGPTEVEEEAPPVEEEPEDTPPQQAENGAGDEALPPPLLIRVSGESIFHGEEEINISQLRNLLREHDQPGLVWELRDEQAILAVYDEVRVLLMEYDVSFTETSG